MRTSTFLLSLLFSLCTLPSLFAQKLIALHHEGAVSYFTDLAAAYNASVSGDTLYLPGGSFNNGLNLEKSLIIIGVGHNPDSTAATGPTIFGALGLWEGSSNSQITGIYINSTLYSGGNVSNIAISRCYLKGGLTFYNGTRSNWVISENWVGIAHGGFYYSIWQASGGSTDFFISNNVVGGHIPLYNSSYSNNIFLGGALYVGGSVISNNVFYSNFETSTGSSQWYNNLNSGINGGPTGNGNTGSGNYLDGVSLESIFVNYSPGNTFYQNDFHVVNPAYLGNDGTPVGIYGGPFPWKDGSLPFTPHIQAKTIGASTNPDGTLNINITVKAQGN